MMTAVDVVWQIKGIGHATHVHYLLLTRVYVKMGLIKEFFVD